MVFRFSVGEKVSRSGVNRSDAGGFGEATGNESREASTQISERSRKGS